MNGAIDIPDGPAVTMGGKPHVFQDTIDTMHTVNDILGGTRAPYAKIEDKGYRFLHGFHDRDQFLNARREI